MAKKVRNDRLNIEWLYARQCWAALVAGQEIPPIPHYTIWEKDDEFTKPEKVVGTKPITPNPITFNGVRYFGEQQ